MTQENKNLLLSYLSMALPYDVKVNHKGLIRPLFGVKPTQYYQITLDNAIDGEHNGLELVSLDTDEVEIKPYLRSFSSMTEEEYLEYHDIKFNKVTYKHNWKRIDVGEYHNIGIIPIEDYIVWLLKKRFDFMGLIPQGLAIEVTKDNNPYKE